MEFGIIGTSIWQQNLPLLERLTVDRGNRDKVLTQLKESLELEELTYLATCNRIEFVYVSKGGTKSNTILHHLVDFFFNNGRDICFFPNDFYHYTGKEAITHLFRTVASLESLVVGETQITGQFRQAYDDAADSGLAGPVIGSLIKEALMVARKVKRETDIGAGSVSMASLAASQICRHLNKTTDPVVALVGSGTMTRKLAKYISKATSARMIFVNRTVDKVRAMADEFGGDAVSLGEFIASPCAVDALASATAATEVVFDRDFANRLPKRTQPVLAIDLAIPRDFAPDLDSEETVTVIDIPCLKSMGQGNLKKKFVEVSKANQIVRDAVTKFLSNRIEIALKPIFHDSYKESIALANKALDDLFARRVTSLTPEDREEVQRLVTKLISHSAFQPARMVSSHLVETRADLNLEDIGPLQKTAV